VSHAAPCGAATLRMVQRHSAKLRNMHENRCLPESEAIEISKRRRWGVALGGKQVKGEEREREREGGGLFEWADSTLDVIFAGVFFFVMSHSSPLSLSLSLSLSLFIFLALGRGQTSLPKLWKTIRPDVWRIAWCVIAFVSLLNESPRDFSRTRVSGLWYYSYRKSVMHFSSLRFARLRLSVEILKLWRRNIGTSWKW